MGYYTDYSIRCEPPVKDENIAFAMNELFGDITGYGPLGEILWATLDHSSYYNNLKWYDHHDDMEEFSRMYPEYTFHLEGIGEEQGDLWKKEYKDGVLVKFLKGVITYEEVKI
jgi:hypothetical protein